MLGAGTQIDRYELVLPLGETPEGEVWAARQKGAHGFERVVTLLVTNARLSADPHVRERVLGEVKRVGSIEHANVAQVLDVGTSNDSLFVVSEYIDGESLFALTRAEAATLVPTDVALWILSGVCAGLAAAHARGIVHRDVSPQKVMLDTRGQIKLVDFGVALSDRAGDPAADVFKAGVLLHRMLGGRATSGVAERTDLPPQIAEIATRATAPDPTYRFANAVEMLNAAEEAIRDHGYLADVASWVTTNLSSVARKRQRALSSADVSGTGETFLSPVAVVPKPPAPKGPPTTQPSPPVMDVRALVAQRGSAPAFDPPAKPGAGEPRKHVAPASEPTKPEASKYAKQKRVDTEKRPLSRSAKIGIGAGIFLAVFLTFFFCLPFIVRDRAIAAAREVGIELTIESVGVSFRGFTLHDVSARATLIPSLEVHVDEIHAAGWSQPQVWFTGTQVKLSGAHETLDASLQRLLVQAKNRFGQQVEAKRISISSAHVAWDQILGEGTRFQAGEVSLDIEPKGRGNFDYRTTLGRFEVTTPKTIVGPWSASYEEVGGVSRARLAFDPPVPDGPNALFVWGKTAPHVQIRIPRTPITNLGVRPSDLGLGATATTELEVSIEGGLDPQRHVVGSGHILLAGARVPGWSQPLNIGLDGVATGSPDTSIDLTNLAVTVGPIGPFSAVVNGTVTFPQKAVAFDATFKTKPVSCESLVRAEAKNMGSIVSTLQEIAQVTGAARVTGTAHAAGTIHWDSAAPSEPNVKFTAKDSCGLTIFGR